jgi:tol-pal system protein YbgF
MRKIDNLKKDMDSKTSEIDELQTKVDNNEKTIAELSGHVAGEYAGIGGKLGEAEYTRKYKDALQVFYNRQYKESIRQFKELLASNPENGLASNCQYWIGESYNGLGEYGNAIDAFNQVMRYRSSYKLDDALLMSGLCYMKMGDRNTARDNFQELISRYPDSEYAPKAMRYLGSL